MRLSLSPLIALSFCIFPFLGCNGQGLFVGSFTVDTPSGSGDDGLDELDDTELEAAEFSGIWVAAFSDDDADQ